jgi:hypothetical protein
VIAAVVVLVIVGVAAVVMTLVGETTVTRKPADASPDTGPFSDGVTVGL